MNILFTWPIYINPQSGGVERVTDILAREFTRRGHTVSFLHINPFGELPKYDYPVNIYVTPNADINSSETRQYYKNLLESNNIDIIINQAGLFETTSLFGDINPENHICLNVIHCNPLWYYKYLFSQIKILKDSSKKEFIKRIGRILLYPKVKRNYIKRIRNHYDFLLNSKSPDIVLLSGYYKSSIKFINPSYPDEYVHAIGNPLPFEISHPKKENIILWVGRMEQETKRPDRMIEIWRRIYKKCPSWKLIMIGDGPSRKQTEQSAQDLPRIEFTGFVNPEEYYRRASVLCMTSTYEGLSMVLIESMAYGVIPMAFDSFEAVHDSNAGELQLVKPFRIREYARKLQSILELPPKGLQMLRDKGYNTVAKFDKRNIADQWENLFKLKKPNL